MLLHAFHLQVIFYGTIGLIDYIQINGEARGKSSNFEKKIMYLKKDKKDFLMFPTFKNDLGFIIKRPQF